MGKKMVDTHQRELIDLAESLGIVEPHQQSGDQSGSLSHSNSGNIFQSDICLFQSA